VNKFELTQLKMVKNLINLWKTYWSWQDLDLKTNML